MHDEGAYKKKLSWHSPEVLRKSSPTESTGAMIDNKCALSVVFKQFVCLRLSCGFYFINDKATKAQPCREQLKHPIGKINVQESIGITFQNGDTQNLGR